MASNYKPSMKSRIQHTVRLLLHNEYVHIFVLTLIIAGTQWYNRNIFGDPDAQFHLTVAKIMPLWPTSSEFFWLPFTSWGSAYADQHYLFHLILKPFTLINAGQVIIILGFLANILGFNWLLKQVTNTNRVPWLWFYTLGSADLLTRVSLIKAEATGMVFLYLLTGLLIKRKWSWLLPVMALYTLWYGGSTIFLVILAAYCVTHFFTEKVILLKPIYWTLSGLFLALLVHPYRATLPALLYDQITRAGLLREIPGGNEWYAQPAAFLPDNLIIFLPWVISILYVIKHKKFTTHTAWFMSISSGLLFVLALYSNRVTLYWVPYALLLSAAMLSQPLQAIRENIYKAAGQKLRKILLIVLAVFLCLRGIENMLYITSTIHRIGLPINRMQNAAEWLSNHTQPGDIVTNVSWHIFPELFYWNTKNRYIAGEDPAFLWIADPVRYNAWKRLDTSDSIVELVASMRTLNSTWLIVTHNQPNNPPRAENLQQVYEDTTVRILRLTK